MNKLSFAASSSCVRPVQYLCRTIVKVTGLVHTFNTQPTPPVLNLHFSTGLSHIGTQSSSTGFWQLPLLVNSYFYALSTLPITTKTNLKKDI